jgi:hypothetical protein
VRRGGQSETALVQAIEKVLLHEQYASSEWPVYCKRAFFIDF